MTAVLIPRAQLARLAAGPVVLAVGLGSSAVAQGPGRFTTYAGRSGLAAMLTVAAGLALVGAGLATALNRPAERIGDLAVLAGLVWFAPVWVGWDKGSCWSAASGCSSPGSRSRCWSTWCSPSPAASRTGRSPGCWWPPST